MNTNNSNWRDNCIHCPFFDECKPNKSPEECKSFLEKKIIEQIKEIFKNSKAE